MKIAIASGKGGTGKTFVATNIFYALQQSGWETTLVDCDAEAPNVLAFFETLQIERSPVLQSIPVIDPQTCTYCGRCHDYCAYHAIFFLPGLRVIRLIEELCHACGACLVACQDNAISEKSVSVGEIRQYSVSGKYAIIEARTHVGTMSPVPVIKKAIKMVGKKEDVIIYDAPPGTSCPFVHTVAAADYVILVTEPTPFGLSDLKRSVETLRQLGKPLGVIINRAGMGNDAVKQYLQDEGIDLLLEIPFDKEIAVLYSRGELAAADLPWLQQDLSGVIENILQVYGNSSHQR